MKPRIVLCIALLTMLGQAAIYAQKPLRASLLLPLPRSSHCADSIDQVAAACFRVHETLNTRFKAGDTVWIWIVCPQNFGQRMWRANSLYELSLDSDTSRIRSLAKISLPLKPPIGQLRVVKKIGG